MSSHKGLICQKRIPRMNTITILAQQTNLQEAYTTAFRTKEKTLNKKSKYRAIKKQQKLQLHQIFAPDTWLIDLVKFNDFYYVFFVEANTRYLISIVGNGDLITNDAIEQTGLRVKTDRFYNIFKQFEKKNVIETTDRGMKLRSYQQQRKRINKIIGDSEKAFWSQMMINYYKSQRIEYEKINTVVEGHIRLSILDRLVRTIRDMVENAKIEVVSPNEMNTLAEVYNNTNHKALMDFTPYEVHNDFKKERMIIERRQGSNMIVRNRYKQNLQVGDIVYVRRLYAPFEKHRYSTVRELYRIIKINNDSLGIKTYDIEGIESKHYVANVARRDLRPIDSKQPY